MPLIFRMISSRVRWYKEGFPSWVGPNDIPADPLADLRTQSNALSVWLVDDDKANLDQIAAAIASTRGSIDKLDYLLFDSQVLSESNVKAETSKGTTPDDQVNGWRLDIIEISGLKLVALTRAILTDKYETGRVLPKRIQELVTEAVNSGRIDRERLTKRVRQGIGS